MLVRKIGARRRLVMVAAIATLVLFGGALVVLAAAPPNIDTFATAQATLNAVLGTPASGIATESSGACLLYTSPSPRDGLLSRMPSSA